MTVMINPICSVNLFSFIHSSLLSTYCVPGTYSLRTTEEGGFHEPPFKSKQIDSGVRPLAQVRKTTVISVWGS